MNGTQIQQTVKALESIDKSLEKVAKGLESIDKTLERALALAEKLDEPVKVFIKGFVEHFAEMLKSLGDAGVEPEVSRADAPSGLPSPAPSPGEASSSSAAVTLNFTSDLEHPIASEPKADAVTIARDAPSPAPEDDGQEDDS